jgi:hypothetical protein
MQALSAAAANSALPYPGSFACWFLSLLQDPLMQAQSTAATRVLSLANPQSLIRLPALLRVGIQFCRTR